MPKPEPWKLDPTYLEQSGLDPQQVKKEIDAAVRQTQSSTPPPPPPQPSSSSAGYRPVDRLVEQQSSSSNSTPSQTNASTSVGYRPADRLVEQQPPKSVQAASPPSSGASSSGRGGPSADAVYYQSLQKSFGGSAGSAPQPKPSGGQASPTKRPEPWKLDPTYLEQTGLDPQQVKKEIDAAVRQALGALGGSSGGGSSSNGLGVDYTKGRGLWGDSSTLAGSAPGSGQSGGRPVFDRRRGLPKLDGSSGSGGSGNAQNAAGYIPADYSLNQRNPENIVNRLLDAYNNLKKELDQTVGNYSNVLAYDPKTGAVGMSPQLQSLYDRYKQAINELKNVPDLVSLLMQNLGNNVLVFDEGEGSPDLQLTPGKMKEWAKKMKDVKVFVIRDIYGNVNVQLAPDVEKTVQEVANLNAEVGKANEDYWRQIQNVVNQFNKSQGGKFKITITQDDKGNVKIGIDDAIHKAGLDKLKELDDEYSKRLDALMKQFGATVQVGPDGRKTILVDPSKYDKFRAKLDELNKWYDTTFNSILKEHGLTIKTGDDGKQYIAIDMSIYSGAFNEIDKINQEHNKRIQDIRTRYSHLLTETTDESGNVKYVLKPFAQDAVTLYNKVVDIVNTYSTTVQQKVLDVANKYPDVIKYDPATGTVAPSDRFAALWNQYVQAVQDVNKIVTAMNTVAGMIPTFASQLPVLPSVTFQTYDKTQGKWVETGSPTPIYVRDEKLRKEIVDWMSKQGKDQLAVVALHDPNSRGRPYVVYVFNKETKEGYVIDPVEGTGFHVKGTEEGRVLDPATGKWVQLRGIELYIRDKSLDIWNKSLTDKEKKELEQYYRLEWEKEQTKQTLQNLPPVVRELYGALITAGQYAPISSSVDIVIRAVLGQEDPLAGTKKVHKMAEAVQETSPAAYLAGTGIGLAGLVGLGAESILARGATKLAQQGARVAAEDITKFAIVKKPEFPVTGPIQYIQQTAKAPTVLQTAVAGLRDAAVPMAISGAAFGGLEAGKSYLETGRVDVSGALWAAAFGSLMGAFPITKTQALAALGVGAGATAGAGLLRGYDLSTSLAVGEAAGLTAIVGGGAKSLSEAGAKTPGVKTPEVKITDFATVVKPEGRPRPIDAEYLVEVERVKPLERLIGNIVADVISGRASVEEANLRLGALRDAVLDKTLFDKAFNNVLQSLKTIKESPREPDINANFVTVARRAFDDIIRMADAGKMSPIEAFQKLYDLRSRLTDAGKAKFDKLFGDKLKEYGEQHIQWLFNSGLSKESVALQLSRYEDVLKPLIEKYMPDYGKVLADVESRLSQLRPVSPREAPTLKLPREELEGKVKALFEEVLAGRKDFFEASEELYRLWNRLSPESREELEAILHDLNAYYGEKYGLTLEPWKPSLRESILHRADLLVADVRSALADVKSVLANAPKATAELIRSTIEAVENFVTSLPDRWRDMRLARLDDELSEIADSFSSGKARLEEVKTALAELAGRYEKLGDEERAKMIRDALKDDEALKKFLNSVLGLRRGSSLGTTMGMIKPYLTRARNAVEAVQSRLNPELLVDKWRSWRFAEAERRLLDIVKRFERGEIDLETAKREVSKLVKNIEKTLGKETAEGYMKSLDLVALRKEFGDVVGKFRRGEISAEDARKRLMEIVDAIEKKFGKEKADLYRNYAEEVLTGKRVEPARTEEKPRLPDDKDVEWIKRAEEEERRLKMERGSGRGQQQLLLLKEEPKALLDREVIRIVERFRRGELTAEEARRRILDAARRAEKFDKALAAFYRRLADAVERGDLKTLEKLMSTLKAASELKPEVHVMEPVGVWQVLRPEVRSALVEGLETRQRLRGSDATLTAPMTAVAAATQLQLRKPELLYAVREFETLKPRRRVIIPTVPQMPTEVQQLTPPPAITYLSEGYNRITQYEPMTTTTTDMPTTSEVVTPTYTPVTVPKISEVPTVDIPTVPTYDTAPIPQPDPLPPGWWRLLPPSAVAGSSEGAYKVQAGKKQILALA